MSSSRVELDSKANTGILFGCADQITYRNFQVLSGQVPNYDLLLPLPLRPPLPVPPPTLINIISISHKKKDNQYIYVGVDERDLTNTRVRSWVYFLPNHSGVTRLNKLVGLKTFPITNRIFYPAPVPNPLPIPLLTHLVSIPE